MNPRDERRQLRGIERWFERNDPVLAATLAGQAVAARPVRRGAARACLALLGVCSVVLGAMTQLPLVFAGVVALMVAACLHVTRHAR
ncbi:DUF3040 domain-containing protein [Saccharothrix longispora]|uniref:Membrane protein YccC n=1 Tax=Saccharothrix longispora TaxID=33920 RepID=A0ABU1PMU4_9PSEU|nr:DUF3040 domain-containing protein [Saccharothrix longispora]MDR6591881.1 putative membrane protein YccC [Saccharothrix longispora]